MSCKVQRKTVRTHQAVLTSSSSFIMCCAACFGQSVRPVQHVWQWKHVAMNIGYGHIGHWKHVAITQVMDTLGIGNM